MIGDNTYTIYPGDSGTFDYSIPHAYLNKTENPAHTKQREVFKIEN